MIDESAAVMHYYIYDPFGQMLESGSAANAPTNAFLFTGQWYDTEIGQYYLRARQYDPTMMRFTTRDPVKGKGPMITFWAETPADDILAFPIHTGLCAIW
ncbi:MAG: RHS repeat-associated core domain-containing protein [Planctomycetales bacterium]|nr:RHS repeat-associated core domain-containing protein [Planctomycetales bacterium]